MLRRLLKALGLPRKAWIDDHSYMIFLSRDGYRYVENDHAVDLWMEMLVNRPYFAVLYTNSIKSWLPPFDNEPITIQKRYEIAYKVKEFMEKKQGRKIMID